MKFGAKESKVVSLVQYYHQNQLRKYTGDPYVNHLYSVANICMGYDIEFGVEIALCHDLLEDTICTYKQLVDFLIEYGYSTGVAVFIANGVWELTDQFTSESYPKMNRAARKDLEAARLIQISPNSQSVKYADIIDNTGSIVEHDPGFARVYLREIGKKIYGMNKGNPELYKRCLQVYEGACETLKILTQP